jgi:hypothetical protein
VFRLVDKGRGGESVLVVRVAWCPGCEQTRRVSQSGQIGPCGCGWPAFDLRALVPGYYN